MSQTITAMATLICALATLVTAVGGVWVGIASNRNLSKRMKVVHENTNAMQDDITDMKGDMFSLTSVITQSVAPKRP